MDWNRSCFDLCANVTLAKLLLAPQNLCINVRFFDSFVSASESGSDLDVWSGAIGVLAIQTNSVGSGRKLYLGRDSNNRPAVPVPRLLFKYVFDRRANRGLVFVVVNDPDLNRPGPSTIICKRQPICENLYPNFENTELGYTYCCTLEGFVEVAKLLGLPVFISATSVGGLSNDFLKKIDV